MAKPAPLAAALVLVACAPAFASEPAPPDKGLVVRIGVPAEADPWFIVNTYGPTMRRLRKELPGIGFVTVELPDEDLIKAVRGGEIDMFMASSAFYAVAQDEFGARHMATRHRREASDPARSVGAVLVAASDDARYRTIGDLRGAKVAAYAKTSFSGWIAVLGEIAASGFDEEKFFGKAIFTNYALPDVPTLVLAGEADVGILRACDLEALESNGAVPRGKLRVINEKTGTGLACRASTALYPDMVFASLPSVPSRLAKEIAVAVLTMEKARDGSEWTFAGDFGATRALFRSLRIGPYEYLRETTPLALIKRYRMFFYAAAALFALALAYIVSVRRIVRVRTRHLTQAIKERDEAERQAREDRERLSLLERAGIVSELSGMIAHEVRQPIASLVNYAEGLREYLGGDAADPIVGEATREITSQARRVSGIVERVRSYARNGRRNRGKCDLAELAVRAVKTFGHSSRAAESRIVPLLEAGCEAEADPLEIELVIVNLLRNAAAAGVAEKDGLKPISLCVSREGPLLRVSVTDNGPVLSDEALRSLGRPAASAKPEGLGLGLSICRAIAESHGGRLEFARRPERGLAASLILPASGAGAGRREGGEA